MKRHRTFWMGLVVAVASAGCQAPPEADVGSQQEDLRIALGHGALAIHYADSEHLPHGVAGDARVVFVAEPLNGRVVARDRFTGREVGTLPAPADGALILPFAMRTPSAGRLVLLDPGGFPDPFSGVLPTARIIEYDYSYRRRRFEAEHVRTLSLAGAPTVFTEDVEVLPDGTYVVAEAGIGALWLVTADGVVIPGVFPASPAPADTIPQLGPCPFPTGVVVDGIPFALAGNFAPGVGALAADDTYLYFGSTCAGGLYRLPLAALFDARPPFARAADIELFSAAPAGQEGPDVLKGLSIDIYGDPDSLYAASPFQLAVVRIDLETGERETVVHDDWLLDFPVTTAFLPTGGRVSELVVVSDQEHRWSGINVALEGVDLFRQPFRIAKVYVLPHHH